MVLAEGLQKGVLVGLMSQANFDIWQPLFGIVKKPSLKKVNKTKSNVDTYMEISIYKGFLMNFGNRTWQPILF